MNDITKPRRHDRFMVDSILEGDRVHDRLFSVRIIL